MLGHVETNSEIELPVQPHPALQIGFDETLGRNIQLVYLGATAIHSPNVVDAILLKYAQPDAASATNVAD
jgi:hypothetical protein